MLIRYRLVFCLVLAAAPAALQAQAAPPTCDAPEYRQFDFWVGDWDVNQKQTTTRIGTNNVTREEQGCLVHEHWAGLRGGTGQSFNYYDRQDGKWHQVWVSSSGNILVLSGGLKDGAMDYTGETTAPDGTRLTHHLTFTPNDDGSVRQYWQVSSDGGKTWNDSFDATYHRKSPD